MSAHKPKQYFDADGNLYIKPYRLKDLVAIFDVNENTFKKWMARYPEQLGKKDGKYYSICQVEFMIAEFGLPQKLYIMRTSMRNAAWGNDTGHTCRFHSTLFNNNPGNSVFYKYSTCGAHCAPHVE